MKLFVAICFILAVASARPQGGYQASAANFDLLNPSNWDASNWDASNLDPSNWKVNMEQMNNWWKNSEWRETLKNWRQGSGPSSTAAYPTTDRKDTVSYSATPAATNFNINEIMTNPWGSLDQATAALDDLNKDFPDVLAKVDPTIKDDINEVNNIVAEVCDQIAAGAKPSSTGFNFFSKGSLKSTCDYIKKTAREVSLGMDDPAVVSNLIDSLKQFTNQFNSFRSSGASY